MYEPIEYAQAAQGETGGRRRVGQPVPWLVQRVSRPFGRRHPTGVAVTRWLVASWLVLLGTIFCASGQWWGVILFALAGLVGWLAYQMPRWSPEIDARQREEQPR